MVATNVTENKLSSEVVSIITACSNCSLVEKWCSFILERCSQHIFRGVVERGYTMVECFTYSVRRDFS